MPAELLLRFIAYAKLTYRPLKRLSELRLVSKAWQEFIDTTPSLWTTLYLEFDSGSLLNTPEVAFAILRSAGAPLVLRFRYVPVWNSPEHSSHSAPDVSFSELLTTLAPRTSTLHVDHLGTILMLNNFHWPLAESLHLRHQDYTVRLANTTHKGLWKEFLKRAPRIGQVHLFETPWGLDRSVTTMEGFPGHAVHSYQYLIKGNDLRDIVQRLPCLSYLDICVLEPPHTDAKTLIAPSLTKARVEACTNISNLLSGIILSQLRTLTIDLSDAWNEGTRPFRIHQLPALQTVSIVWYNTTIGPKHIPVCEFLKNLSGIQHLTLSHQRGGDRVMATHPDDKGWGPMYESTRSFLWTWSP